MNRGEIEREIMIATDSWERVEIVEPAVVKWLGPRRPWRLLAQREPGQHSAPISRVHPIAYLAWRYRGDFDAPERALRRLLRRLVELPEFESACLSAVALAGVDGLRDLVPLTARERGEIRAKRRRLRAWFTDPIVRPPEHAQCRSSLPEGATP